jgi:chromosome segregation ATPase
MHNSQILNLNPNPQSEGRPEQIAEPESDNRLNQVADSIEQARNDVRRLRLQLDRQENSQEDHVRRTKSLMMFLAVLLLILAVASWWAYPILASQQGAAVEMFGLKDVAASLKSHVAVLEARLDKTAEAFPGLTSRMDQLQAGLKSTLQNARTQAQAAATQVGEHIRRDFNQSMQAVQARVAGLESNQHEASQRVDELQKEIAGLKQELATIREASTAAASRLSELQDEQKVRAGAVSNLEERMTSHQSTLTSISNQMERQRVEFQLADRRSHEVAPGIHLTIKGINVGRQEVDAAVQMNNPSQALTLRGQSIQQPVSFYRGDESRPAELVFTDVNKGGVAGYLLIPATSR